MELRRNAMKPDQQAVRFPMQHLVVIRQEQPGQYTAQAVGIPEIRATAATREEAIAQVRQLLAQWLETACWVQVEVATPAAGHPLLEFAGHSKDDPDFEGYLEEIRRYRQEVDERACSDSSSTPTT
jgi:hypothetical protein